MYLIRNISHHAEDTIFSNTFYIQNQILSNCLIGFLRLIFEKSVIKVFYLFRSKEYLLFKVTLLLCSKSRFIIGVNENELNSIITGDKLLNIVFMHCSLLCTLASLALPCLTQVALALVNCWICL